MFGIELRRMREELAAHVAAFDPAAVALPDAPVLLDEATRIVNLSTTLQTLLAARIAEGDAWRDAGEKSAADDLAKKSGTSTAAAKEKLDTAKRLKDQPAVEDAARRGELSAQQAAAIADAA